MISLSVIILAFNEEENIETSLKEIENVLKVLAFSYEIIIIDDGSTDSTGEIADHYGRINKFARSIHHITNLGIGEGYRTGFNVASHDYVTFFPADGQFPATILLHFTHMMENADMVLGYFQHRKRSFIGSILSYGERLLYRLLFGRIPKFQGILMFRRRMLDEIELKSSGRGWGVLLELIIQAQRKGYRIVHVPIEVRPRLSGRSKVNNIKTIYANLIQALKLRLQMT